MPSADERIVLAVVLGVCAGTAAAQTAPPPPPSPPPAAVEPSRIAAYHESFRVLQVAGGDEQEVATVEDRVILTDHQIIRLQSVSDAGGVMHDSSVIDRATLRPRWHSSKSERRSMHLAFTPKHVDGRYAERSSPSRDIHETVSEGVFDASVLDLLIAALPLTEGYRGRLSVFLWEAGGEIPADVTVTGSATIGDMDTWAVDVTLKDRTARYNVTKRQPRVARIVSSPAPGVEIRFVQQPG